MVKVRYLQSNS